MNRIHRIIFNRMLGEYRVASEHAKGHGKAKTLIQVGTGMLLLLLASPAWSMDIKDGEEKRVGGTEFWSAWPELHVGNGTDGTLVIEEQGEVESAWGRIGTAGATGSVTVSDQGIYWVDELTVGHIGSESQPGTGILTVTNGGTIYGVSGYIGDFETAQGAAEITGAGSLWEAVNDVTVGRHGTGTLTIADGGKLDAGAVYIGYGETGSGRLSVESGGILETGLIEKGEGSASFSIDGGILRAANDEENFMRNFGAGDVAIDEGGVFIDSNGHDIGIAAAMSGPGDLTKIGAGALTLTGNNAVRLFSVDEGTLRIDEGGALRDQGRVSGEKHYIGTQAGIPAELIVAGGTLAAEASFEIADAPGTVAGLSISGENAQANLGLISVGDNGTGQLVVENGGKLSVGSAYIGGGNSNSTGTGSLSVSGEGSSVEARGQIIVGSHSNGATGLVALSEGGKLTSNLIELGQQNADGSARLIIGADSVNPADAIGAGILDTSEIQLYSDIASVNFNHTNGDYLFSAPLVSRSGSVPLGSGALNHYAGTTTLTGDSSGFLGATTVYGGTLRVGDASGRGRLGGTVDVQDGATLGGSGTVGTTTVADGGILAPGSSIGTLTVSGDLLLSPGSILDYELGSPGASGNPAAGVSDRIDVVGDLALNGTLNLAQSDNSADGTAGFGYYRLMTYGGTLTDHGLTVGETPALADANGYEIQAGEGKVDLFISTASDDTLQHWQGGDGAWNDTNAQWLNKDGNVPVAWAGNHAVFKNQRGGFDGGMITVEGVQPFKGLQFVDEGYRLEGAGALQTDANGSEIRVLADRAEIAAQIAGDGGITKTQAGTLVLSGDNRYQGGTRILGGAVSVASDRNLGAVGGGLLLRGGTLATTADMATARAVSLAGDGGFDVAADTTLAATGPVTGQGDLIKTGAGTLHLAGTNGYGNTVVRQGGLIGNTGSISGHLANEGEVAFYQEADGTFAGDISGSGRMRKFGFGTLTLAGRNTLDWVVDIGQLRSAGSRFTGDVAIGPAGSLVLDDAQPAAYAGALSGAGRFHKAGVGSLLLTGDSAGFAGHTTVHVGSLRVGDRDGNGALGGSLDVLKGATLGGSGTVGAGAGSLVTVASGGTLAPGNSIGTLTVDGDLAFEKGSRLQVEVDPQGTGSDQVAVTGDTAIQGGSVAHVGATGQYGLRSPYTLLTTGGTLSGAFDTVTSDFAFLTPELLYDYGTGTVDLELARNERSFASVAQTRNQRVTADGIESIGLAAGHAVYDAIAQLPDDPSRVRASLDALSGEIHASTKTALIEDSRFVRDAAKDRVRAAFAAPAASSAAVSARTADGAPAAVLATHHGPVVWSQAFGAWGSTDSDGNAASLDRNIGGMLIGADRAVGDWRVGALAGYSYTDAKAPDRNSSGRSDNYHLGMYGGTQWGALGLRTGLAYTWHDVRSRRSVDIPGLSDSLRGDYDGGAFQAFGELGYGIELSEATRLEPFASLAYVRLHTDGYREQGGDAALAADSATTETTFSTLGLRAEHALSFGTVQGAVRAMAGWRHAMGGTTPEARHAFSSGDAFTVAGVPIAQDSAAIELGVGLAVARNVSFGLSYAGQIASSAQDHGVKANLQIRF